MSGIIYKTQAGNGAEFSHTFDYQMCKIKYEEYANLSLSEFKKALKDQNKIGEIGHISCFVMWCKNLPGYKYRDSTSDYGLLHLLFHCMHIPSEIEEKRIEFEIPVDDMGDADFLPTMEAKLLIRWVQA